MLSNSTCYVFNGQTKGMEGHNKLSFICPTPGFDRHFRILEDFEIDTICIPFQEDGIDLIALERALKSERNVVGAYLFQDIQIQLVILIRIQILNNF